MKTLLPTALALFAAGVAAAGQNAVTEEVPIGFLPVDWVRSALQKTLSPQGRSALVTPTGPLRLTDAEANVAAARRALADLPQAPALVPVELSFATTARRTVQRLPVEPPVVSDGIPVPGRYDPPRIIQNGAGGVTIVPSMPRDFHTRNVGPGTVVNPSPTGYQTQNSEVRLTETITTGGPTRRFSASMILGKPATLSVVRQLPDAAALRALAVKYGAIADAEPAWAAAGTELLVRPELSGGALVVNITPQIVVAPAVAGQPARHIPIANCAAAVLVARGAPGSTGMLPKTDPEFYRVFLGTPQAVEDSITALTVTGQVQYVGGPPK